jgi:hypothetical protein
MKKQILEELKEMRYLFNYDRGKIISEQEQFESEDDNEDDVDDNEDDVDDNEDDVDDNEDDVDDNEDDNEDLNYLKSEYSEEYDHEDMEVDGDLIENRELEVPVKPGTKTPTKPDKDSPYKPKPGPKKKPKAKKGDMPDWLSFDELGINLKQK